MWQKYRGRNIVLNDFLPMLCAYWDSPYGPTKYINPSPMLINPVAAGTTETVFYNNGGILPELLGKGMYGGLPTSPDDYWTGPHSEIQDWWCGQYERNAVRTGCLYRLVSPFPIMEELIGNLAGRVHDFTPDVVSSTSDLLAEMSICDLEEYLIRRRYQLADNLESTEKLAASMADAMKET